MEKNTILYQDNIITRSSSNMTELERNILYMVIAQMTDKDVTYFISASELMEMIGKDLNFSLFQQATKQLVNRYFEVVLPNGDLLQGTFIAAAKYHKGKGIIELEIAKMIKPFYLNLKEKFTTYELSAALSLSGKYTKRLYEILSMYKNFPDPSVTVPLVDLKRMLGVFNKEGFDPYPKFTHFKKRILAPSVSEINSKTDISFQWTENYGTSIGKGRKPVVSIKLNITKNEVTTNPYPALLLRLTQEFRLSSKQAQSVLQGYSTIEIHKKLYDISINKAQIANIGAYTAKSFNV